MEMETEMSIEIPVEMTELEKDLRMLADVRQATQTLTDTLKVLDQPWIDLQKAIREGGDYHQAQEYLAVLKDQEEKLSADVRQEALFQFEQTGNKKPSAGVTVKMFTDIQVKYDAAQAKGWAMEKAPGLVVLDEKKFTDYAKSLAKSELLGDVLPFVTVSELPNPKAQIATDLSALLVEA